MNKVKTVRKFPWPELLNERYVRLKIIPDSSVRNWRSEDLLRTISEQFRLPIDRLVRNGLRITGFQVQERASFEISFQNKLVTFYLSVPEHISPLIIRRIQSVWDKATVEQVESAKPFDIALSTIYEHGYRKHDMYSIHTDAKDNLPMTSLLEAGRLLGEDERASIFAYFDPLYQLSYVQQMSEAWDKLRAGKVPLRLNASKRAIMRSVFTAIGTMLREIVLGFSEIMSTGKNGNAFLNKPIDPEASRFAVQRLSEPTKQKLSKPGVKTYLWAIVESPDASRGDLIARTLSFAFHDLADDNELQGSPVRGKKREEILRTMQTHKPPRLNLRYCLMSSAEAAKIVQLPGADLQEQYKEIERVEQAQLEVVNKNLFKPDGLLLGEVTFKGKTAAVYQPIHNWDEATLPHIGVGGMGQGKTKGLLSNYAYETVRAGFSCCAIDAAKGEIGDELQAAVDLGVIEPWQLQRFDLGKTPFSLDFCEALHDERARARLANIVVFFFDIAEETTGQTERFLRAAVMAMQTGRIAEIIKILNMNKDNKQQEQHLDNAIETLLERTVSEEDDLNLATLREFKSYDVGMRRKILSPILNRLNDILGDPFLAACMKSENSLDLVDIMAKKGVVTVFDIRVSDLDKVAVNIIASLISLKADLAMRMRGKVHGAEAEFPYFILIDEPHQYMKSTKIWEDAVVESRKWRVTYFWTFHMFEHLPQKLQKAIKSALPHFHIYPSSVETFKSLEHEMKPFTLQDAQKLKTYHAINIIRSGGENVHFIAKMAEPPSKRLKKV